MPARIEASGQTRTDPAVVATKGYLLMADDRADEGGRFRDMLHQLGYACDLVRSGDDVARAFRVRDYDLILLSLHTSFAGVLDTARAVRNMERHFPEPRIPIVALSAGASETERRQAKDGGIDDVVRRPAGADELQAVLDRVLSEERRIPDPLIPREPIQYARLLAAREGNEERARQELDAFERMLQSTLVDLQTAMHAGDIDLARRAGEQLRQTSLQIGSGRFQRLAVLMTRLRNANRLKEDGRELLADLEHAAADLATWRQMSLGQAVVRTPAREGRVRTTIVRLSGLLRNRLDIFSRAIHP